MKDAKEIAAEIVATHSDETSGAWFAALASHIAVAIEQARKDGAAEEREACWAIADSCASGSRGAARNVARLIRARGKEKG